ncbi:phage antirepressor protein [Streptococcus pneumoniae]|nr:phage antirepressor protein [Streptococcus pneumoniae]
MNELINVTLNDNQEPVVSGRQLHEALGVNSRYTTWFDRMKEYGFTEGQDFLPNLGKSTGGRQATDHIIKLDMAKEIAMIQRTDKGAVSASHTSILVGELAKLISQNGYKIGANRLFSWMRENGYLIKRKGSDWNMPTQRSMDLKLFEIKETNVQHADGHITVNKTPKVTGKGQQYFINKFLNQEYLTG